MNLRKLKDVALFKNISWIFFGNILYSLFKFLMDLLIARVLPLDTNGVLNYADSLIAVASAVIGLGISSTITREFAEKEEDSGNCLCSGILTHVGTALIAIVVLQVVVRIMEPGNTQLYMIVLLQSTSTLFGAGNLFVYWFRYRNMADRVALLRLLAFGISALLRTVALLLAKSIVLYVCALAAETLLFGIFLAIAFFKSYKGSFRWSFALVKKMLRISYPFISSSLLMVVYAQTDRIMIKNMLDNSSVALYSASLRLATALSMIPSSLIEGFRPSVMALKFQNEEKYQKRFRQLYCIVFWFSVAYGVFITLFANEVILILYGEKYLGAVSSLSLVVWYSAFSYYGSINNMYMVSEDKSKYVQITTLVGALANVALNYLLIPIWGIIGAAAASLVTQFLANFVMMWIVKDLRKGAVLMVQGITFRKLV